MMQRRKNNHLLYLFCSLVGIATANSRYTSTEMCGLYMAESSIPNSGLGMYTTKSIAVDAEMQNPEITIQLAEFEWNQILRARYLYGPTATPETHLQHEPKWLLHDYSWNVWVSFGNFECDYPRSIVPGIGMLANSHPGLFNADMRRPSIGTGGVHRDDTHATAGSFTYYHDLRFVSYRDLRPGSEVFAEYGDQWFLDRQSKLGRLPISNDFRKVDEFLAELKEQIDEKGIELRSQEALDLWQAILLERNLKIDTTKPPADKSKPIYRTGLDILPQNSIDLEYAVEHGSASFSNPSHVRSLDWLEQHGQCVDNIRSGPSTAPGVGRGAFATRSLTKNQVVSPLPLAHMHRDRLNMYRSNDASDPNEPVHFAGVQLLVNYCFGHVNSSLLFYPYSPNVNFVNHASEGANVKLQWSSHSHMTQFHNASLLEGSIQDVLEYGKSGLILELVATRDIAEGEEIFLDYGAVWQEEFSNHQQIWQQVKKGGSSTSASVDQYRSANDWNQEMNKTIFYYHTMQEQQKLNPYPKNVMTACYAVSNLPSLQEEEKDNPRKTPQGQPIYKWKSVPRLFLQSQHLFECEILQRKKVENDEYVYVVRSYRDDLLDENGISPEWIVTDVPQRAIFFADREYTTDQFLQGAFRREIQIPNDLFPIQWRDLEKTQQEQEQQDEGDNDDQEL